MWTEDYDQISILGKISEPQRHESTSSTLHFTNMDESLFTINVVSLIFEDCVLCAECTVSKQHYHEN